MPNMELREMLLKKEQELEQLVQMAEKYNDSTWPGTLEISNIKGRPRYYHCYPDQRGNKQKKYLSACNSYIWSAFRRFLSGVSVLATCPAKPLYKSYMLHNN